MKILLDTSVLIDFSRTGKGAFLDIVEIATKKGHGLYTPTIVVTEFWAGDDMKKTVNIRKAEKIFSKIHKVDLDEKTAKLAGELMREKHSKGFDAIVAAIALHLGAKLATNNKKHFSRVPKLSLF